MPVTKTLNPLPFQDLEPHRFESLVRQLIYNFKDWLDIEPTGGMGTDDGYDIRGWEKIKDSDNEAEEEKDGEEEPPKELDKSNLWMMQCKREKRISSSKIITIVDDALKGVSRESLPFGYMLIASCNFSKRSHDTFREKMNEYGIQEYYLWGKDKLEDLLFMPTNDQLLFAFFGISLSIKRRKISTNLRYKVSIKNKLIKLLNGSSQRGSIHEQILIRDLNDEKYPFETEYKNFKLKPRWREYQACELHPRGLIVKIGEFYSYFDKTNKLFDYYKPVDLLHRDSEMDDRDKREKESKLLPKILDIWDFLPIENKGKFTKFGYIPYEDIAIIDPEGDYEFLMPHLFVEFRDKAGPFKSIWGTIKSEDESGKEINVNSYKLITHFPKKLPTPKPFKLYKDKSILTDERKFEAIKNYRCSTLYLPYEEFNYLNVRDKIQILKKDSNTNDYPLMTQVLYKDLIDFQSIPYGRFDLENYDSLETMRLAYEDLYGRKIQNTDKYIVLKFRQRY